MKTSFSSGQTAMLLIDYQVGTIKLAQNIPHMEIIRHIGALARIETATEHNYFLSPRATKHAN